MLTSLLLAAPALAQTGEPESILVPAEDFEVETGTAGVEQIQRLFVGDPDFLTENPELDVAAADSPFELILVVQQIIAADAAADLASVLATLRENLERKEELREILEALDALRAELDQTFEPSVASASFGTLVPYWSGAADNAAANLTVAIESLPPDDAAAVNGFLGSSGLAQVVFVEASDPPVEVIRAVDRDFADGDWSSFSLPAAAPETSTGGVTREPEGGKPGAFLRAPLVWGGGAPGVQRTALGFLRWDGFEWDPSVDGEIGTLRLLADLRFGEDGRPGQSAVSGSIALGIEQNDSVYLLRGQGLSAQDPLPGRWQTYQEIVMEPSAFRKVSGPGPEEPDLSTSGAPIRFGVRIGAATSFVGVSIAFDLDNYKAEISAPVRAVPGLPGAGAWILAMLLAAVALVVLKRARPSSHRAES